MWIRKTDEELKKNDSFFNVFFRNKFYVNIAFFIVIIILQFFGEVLIGEGYRYSSSRNVLTIKEAFNKIPEYAIKSIVILLIFYILFNLILGVGRNKKIDKNANFVCDKCNKLDEKNDKINCDCGGEMVHIDKMKWINE